MKKVFAMMLALMLAVTPMLGLAEETQGAHSLKATLSDVVLTVNVEGQEHVIDLTGLSISEENIYGADGAGYVISVDTAEGGKVFGAAAEMVGGVLTVAVDGISKALSLDVGKAAQELLSIVMDHAAEMMTVEPQVVEKFKLDLQNAIMSAIENIIFTTVDEPVEVPFVGGEMLSATGGVVLLPGTVVDKFVQIFDSSAQSGISAVQGGYWVASDGSSIRLEAGAEMDGEMETVALALAMDGESQKLMGELLYGERVVADGFVQIVRNGINAGFIGYDEDGAAASAQIALHVDTDENGMQSLQGELTVDEDGEKVTMNGSIGFDGEAVKVQLDAAYAESTAGVSYEGAVAYTQDGAVLIDGTGEAKVSGAEEITLTWRAAFRLDTQNGKLPGLSGMETMTLQDVMSIFEDGQLLAEVEAVVLNALEKLGTIPGVQGLLSGEF